jgi:hypothetical protein
MSDRGFLFLFSLLMIVGGLVTAGWLLASGQAGTVDGLFLLLTVLLIALVFSLYVVFMIRRQMAVVAQPAAQKAKAGSPAAATAARQVPARS